MREEIRRLHPDLIFLQEVCGHHSGHKEKVADWPDSSQFEFLADEIWPHFSYGKNAVYTEGHHGNAILSKFPILSWENSDISHNRFERRGLLHAVIDLPRRRPLHALCVHMGLRETDRTKQINQLVHRVEHMVPDGDLLIAAGDFNDWREKAGPVLDRRLGLKEVFATLHGRSAQTFPSFWPILRLDRIYHRGFETLAAKSFADEQWTRLSDHVALEAELEIL